MGGKFAYLIESQPTKEDIAAFIEYWQKNRKTGQKLELNGSCAKMADPLTLRYNSIYWQAVVTGTFTLHLFAAYLDVRASNTKGPVVRLLGMTDKLKPRVTMFCQLWFENSTQPVLSEVTSFRYLWFFGGGDGGGDGGGPGKTPTNDLQPYLVTCPIPAKDANRTPTVVSLTERACDTATVLLKVIYSKPEGMEPKKKFAVCVKGFNMPDELSVRLTEWIELAIATGADKIFLYTYEVHPKVAELLEVYAIVAMVHEREPGASSEQLFSRILWLRRPPEFCWIFLPVTLSTSFPPRLLHLGDAELVNRSKHQMGNSYLRHLTLPVPKIY